MKISYTLAVTANGAGAASAIPELGRYKTVQVNEPFTGSLTLEIAHTASGPWAPIKTFTGSDIYEGEFAAAYARVRSSGVAPGSVFTPVVSITGENSKGGFATLAAPLPNAAGASTDLRSSGGDFGTVIIGGPFHGVIGIQVSQDDVNWVEILSFQPSDSKWQNVKAITNYVRAVSRGGLAADAPVITVGQALEASGQSLDFGNGSDGDVTLVANIQLSRNMYYRTLHTAGYDIDLNGFALFCSELLDVQTQAPGGGSLIHSNGLPGVAAVGGLGAAAGMVGGGADGGDGNVGAAGDAGDAQGGDVSLGGTGGAGGTGNGGGTAGGLGGAVTNPLATATQTEPKTPPESTHGIAWDATTAAWLAHGGGAGGGAGGGDAAATAGGGGGGGGGVAVVAAKTIKIAATSAITASGGAGAAGPAADCGGGGGGGGGLLAMSYHMIWNLGSLLAAGGAAGASGGGTGVIGSVGTPGTIVLNVL